VGYSKRKNRELILINHRHRWLKPNIHAKKFWCAKIKTLN